MPVYDYRCDKCDKESEFIQRINDSHPTCPECGKVLRRIITSMPSVVYNGKGFYVNDNKSSERKATV